MPDRDAPTPRHAVSRRDFLEHTGRLAGGLLALGSGGLGLLSAGPARAAARLPFAAGRFALELDGRGAPVLLQSFEGGSARGEVVSEGFGRGGVGLLKKQIGALHFEPIKLRASLGSGSKPLLDRVQTFLQGGSLGSNGAVVVADLDFKVRRRLEFTNARIGEVTFPALDTSSKEAAFVDVTLLPEHTDWVEAKGEPLAQDVKGVAAKRLLLSSFDLKIGELDGSGISRIEALTIRTSGEQDAVGAVREPVKQPTRLELPNLVVLVSEAKATDFVKWHEDFVIKGNNADDQEKSGELRFLDPTRKETLASLVFEHVGIFAASPTPVSSTDAIARLKIEMYCESIKLGTITA